MIKSPFTCLDSARRRLAVEAGANGIDYVRADGQQIIVGLLQPLHATAQALANAISNPATGEISFHESEHEHYRLTVSIASKPKIDQLSVRNDAEGYGVIEITLTNAPAVRVEDSLEIGEHGPHPRFDKFLSSSTFRFEDGDAGDCGPLACPPAEPIPGPAIDYLAKDYSSFRRLMFDRLSQTLPGWTERRAADLGVTVLEVLAYAADHLSYYQDAVATEAYLATARRRTSVRRHARLVDYRMHEGCNARAWVHVAVNAKVPVAGLTFLTVPSDPARKKGRPVITNLADLTGEAEADRVVFEPMLKKATLHPEQNALYFYAGGNTECCLPAGSIAALIDAEPDAPHAPIAGEALPGVNDLLLIEEVIGPQTGRPEDADATRRHVVRLTRVETKTDRVPDPDAKGKEGRAHWKDHIYLEVEWGPEDALPFSVCVATDGRQNVSVLRGNMVLVDQGLTIAPASTDLQLPEDGDDGVPSSPCAEGHPLLGARLVPAARRQFTVVQFSPLLRRPLTHAAPFPDKTVQARTQARWHARQLEQDTHKIHCARGGAADAQALIGPASADLRQNLGVAVPSLWLTDATTGLAWESQRDLLDSGPEDRHFVIEFDDWGEPWLRFGDGHCGLRPRPGTTFQVAYRFGSSATGNVGAEAITGVLGTEWRSIIHVRNPLAAFGGTDPEPIATVKRLAPTAFKTELRRAVAAEDYAALAREDDRVLRASSSLAWTGTGYEVDVVVQIKEAVFRHVPSRSREEELIHQEIEADLNRVRRIGHSVHVQSPREVPIVVKLGVMLRPHLDPDGIKAAIKAELGTGELPGGRRGFFHPDAMDFGHAVAASEIMARARAVPGVLSVEVQELTRVDGAKTDAAGEGVLEVGALEVIRLSKPVEVVS